MRLREKAGWDCLELALLLGSLFFLLWYNASKFDDTEWDTLQQILLVGLGIKLLGKVNLK